MTKNIELSYSFSEEDKETLRDIIREEVGQMIYNFGQRQRESANFYTTKIACERLKITRPTLNKWREQGRLIGEQVGTAWYYSEAEVNRLAGVNL